MRKLMGLSNSLTLVKDTLASSNTWLMLADQPTINKIHKLASIGTPLDDIADMFNLRVEIIRQLIKETKHGNK